MPVIAQRLLKEVIVMDSTLILVKNIMKKCNSFMIDLKSNLANVDICLHMKQ